MGHAIGLRLDLAESDRACSAALALPNAGHAIAIGPAVQTVVGDVQASAGEPLSPLRSARGIQDVAIGSEPFDAHFAHHFVPESLRIFAREEQKCLAVLKSEALH